MHSPPPLLRCIPPPTSAIAPLDLVRFYSALFSGVASNHGGVDVRRNVRLAFRTKKRCAEPLCQCHLLTGCMTNITLIGHPGSVILTSLSPLLSPSLFSRILFYSYLPCRIDWGSAIPSPGWLPRYNVSIALAVNALTGMNYSMTLRDNENFFNPAVCRTMAMLLPYLDPNIPPIVC